jgi:hypothetical protein
VDEILSLVNKLSGVSFATLLAIVLFTQWKDYWGWSRDRKAVEKDRDEWKALALENLGIAKKAVDHAARTQDGPPGLSR